MARQSRGRYHVSCLLDDEAGSRGNLSHGLGKGACARYSRDAPRKDEVGVDSRAGRRPVEVNAAANANVAYGDVHPAVTPDLRDAIVHLRSISKRVPMDSYEFRATNLQVRRTRDS